jgi:hypothetical protein
VSKYFVISYLGAYRRLSSSAPILLVGNRLNKGLCVMLYIRTDVPKPPRWISTDAGLWAWQAHRAWRATAANALSVRERHELLQQAEQLHGAADRSSEEVSG